MSRTLHNLAFGLLFVAWVAGGTARTSAWSTVACNTHTCELDGSFECCNVGSAWTCNQFCQICEYSGGDVYAEYCEAYVVDGWYPGHVCGCWI